MAPSLTIGTGSVTDWLLLSMTFAALLLARVPVGFAIGTTASLAIATQISLGPALLTSAQRITTSLDSFPLLAIPLFILAGQLANRGGTASRLIALAQELIGGVRGGLAHVHVVASMLFGSISGSAVAAASAVGPAMGPRMESAGYDRNFSAAVNIAAATTGLVIPPSNVLIVYSLASGGTSIAALFLAGYLPGLLVGLALMIAAALTLRGRMAVGSHPKRRIVKPLLAALPGLGLPVLVMGGIAGGFFTATEASGAAALYALVLGFAQRELTWRDVPESLLDAATTTGVVMLLIGTSAALSWVLSYDRIPEQAAALVLSLSRDPIAVLLLVNLTLLVVGTFMDITPAILIFTPIFLPVVTELGIDPIHFGVIMVVNLCIGLCTPPVGTVLFVGSAVAGTEIREVVRPLIPLVLAMLLALLAVTFVPSISLWLPRLAGATP